ncbi:MAG: class II fructose-bisphosphate aldolase [Spirochaetaceae bacterium]|nr:class II fructose-bisphosphate aldolase [Spirochaetaceae bacterium]MCF7939012.1 class II fructose-bisphosphate aldolase [Spirochaetales bacterium]
MSLITLKEAVAPATNSDFAVPAFNFFTFDDAKAIVAAAEELNSPVILMSSPSCIKSFGVEIAAAIMRNLALQANVPVVAHLDHAEDLDTIFKAMKCGYTSIMYDGSKLPVEENIDNTKTVVRVAKALGISVEAEIGRVGKGEEGEEAEEILTTPESAADFLQQTGVDGLAVAVGTRHAMQDQEANIHFEIVDGISAAVEAPLVLHGSSGVTDGELRRIINTKFAKINIGTVLRKTFINSIRETLASQPDLKAHDKLLQLSSAAVVDKVKEKIRILKSDGKVSLY